ncbi:UNVERIFIED_CONTAM: hypothetical protein Scaly_3040900 [Sesamum calycinum]|uniref:Reverse transcriptase zinc-binding domain-containing protein n=1 Tax=Sesamum calycinum TaxID=2727403 RepID=A0AAW2K7F9_9LAMI
MLSDDLCKATIMEVNMLKQRAKLAWLKGGDNCSKIFFRKITARRAYQRVYQIQNDDGHILTEGTAVTAEEATQITAPVQRHEIKDALFDINEDSAPGPDGFSSSFFKATWAVIEKPGSILKVSNTSPATDSKYIGFPQGTLPVRYLGVPLITSKLSLADCAPLILKIEARIAGWNQLNLTYAGRTQLIKSVLSSIHQYWCSVFILPKGVIKTIDAKLRNFLWRGGTERGGYKVAWEQVCKPTAKGGLGIRNIQTMNNSLMGKHLWQILEKKHDSIWVSWITKYKLRHGTLWAANEKEGSWIWKKLLKLRNQLIKGIRFQVGDGTDFKLWLDPWHPDGTLIHSSGTYSTKDAYEVFSDPCNSVEWASLFHGPFHTPRHKFILWLAILERLSTLDKPWCNPTTKAVYYVTELKLKHTTTCFLAAHIRKQFCTLLGEICGFIGHIWIGNWESNGRVEDGGELTS